MFSNSISKYDIIENEKLKLLKEKYEQNLCLHWAKRKQNTKDMEAFIFANTDALYEKKGKFKLFLNFQLCETFSILINSKI